MKLREMLLATVCLVGFSGAMAQEVEYDDMYFNSEDRAKLREQRALEVAYNTPKKSNKFEEYQEEAASINPTDSYSARNVNPEYISRSHTQTAVNYHNGSGITPVVPISSAIS